VKKISNKQAARLRKYRPIAKKFKEEHPECEARIKGCQFHTHHVHHRAGKIGELLFKVAFFLPCCWFCHGWIENNPLKSYELGFSEHR
jgi:hypothetical protein